MDCVILCLHPSETGSQLEILKVFLEPDYPHIYFLSRVEDATIYFIIYNYE